MTISKRTLEKWRKGALRSKEVSNRNGVSNPEADIIIKLTQELLDQHLMKGK